MAVITKKYCNDRKSPFQLTWRDDDGKRISRFFETEEARDEFIRQHDYLEKRSFEALMTLDDRTISEIAKIESERGQITFKEIWEFWEKHHKAKRVLTLWNACDEYLVDMFEHEKMGKDHLRHIRRVLEVLVEKFGHRRVEDIRRDEIEDWLEELPFAP